MAWRVALIIIAVMAVENLPVRYNDRFLGGGPLNYSTAPALFSWANFDGEHYLSIATVGYKGLEQAFFPVFPMLITFFSNIFSNNLISDVALKTLVGIIVSNLSFFSSLVMLWKLLKIDFSDKLSFFVLIVLLLFPTSFYFAALYNESLFLLLSVSSFYFARKRKWFLASIFGGISSATRIFGILLLPALLIEAWQQKEHFSKAAWLCLIPAGLGIYMFYQYVTVGDPLAFYHLQKLVGEQHLSGITLLPQVYFRYIRMILTTDMQNPIFQTIVLEFFVGIVFFILPLLGYFQKIRYSYLVYALSGFLLPTIQGSFSSVPRYVLVFFPSFISLAILLNRLPMLANIFFLVISFCLLLLEVSLFLRGYWVA